MKKSWIFLIVLVALSIAIFSLGSSSVLQVKQIVVKGNQRITAEEIQHRMQFFVGQNMLVLDEKDVRSKLWGDKRLGKVQTERAWPSTLLVEIEEKEPVLLLEAEKSWGLTETGEILPADTFSPDLPTVTGIRRRNLKAYTRPVVPELEEVLKLYRAIQAKNEQLLGLISEIKISERNRIVLTLFPQNTRVILSPENYEQNVARLIEILGAEEDLAATIDLRFENIGLVKQHQTGKS